MTSKTDVAHLAAELKSVWEIYISPWLSQVGNIADAAHEMEQHAKAVGGSLVTAAACFIVLGQPDKASELVNRQLEDLQSQLKGCHPVNLPHLTKYIAELKSWAGAHHWPGFDCVGETP